MGSQNQTAELPWYVDRGDYPLPKQRTDFWAGSVEKIEIMRRRFETGEHLHHPLDCNLILIEVGDPVARAKELYQGERILRWGYVVQTHATSRLHSDSPLGDSIVSARGRVRSPISRQEICQPGEFGGIRR
jgi:hypothetical protein